MRKTFGVEGEKYPFRKSALGNIEWLNIFHSIAMRFCLCVFHSSDTFVVQVRKNNIQNNYISYSSRFVFAPSL